MVRGHNNCEGELDGFLRTCGSDTCTEQVVPAWNRPVFQTLGLGGKPLRDAHGNKIPVLDEKGTPVFELAVLDNGYHDRKGRRCWADVSYAAASTDDAGELQRRAQTDGRAAHVRELDKEVRYPPSQNPAEGFTPFVFEARGRPGDKAVGLIRAMAPPAGTDVLSRVARSSVIKRAWQGFSVCCQRRLAELLLSAEGTGAPGVRRHLRAEELRRRYAA